MHIHPRRPRLVIAMRCLLYKIWVITTRLDLILSLCCFLSARVLGKPHQQVSSLGHLEKTNEQFHRDAVIQRSG